ncbi:MAG: KH domain-containing protein, partial [Pseudomonadota bacterium]
MERNDAYWETRVTLKIDVPFTDHSHIIGRQGKNTQKVMKDTQCHIHFPDSNKNTAMDKSNQVSIAGPPGMVEEARRQIRRLAPLTVTFELKQMRPDVDLSSLVNHPALENAVAT